MGNLGFLFSFDDIGDEVIFIGKQNFKGEIIIGFKNFKKNDCEYKYLSKDLSLNKFMVLDNTKFRSAKISLGGYSVVDFEHLTFWFSLFKYKKIRDLFEVRNYDQKEVMEKVVKLSEYF